MKRLFLCLTIIVAAVAAMTAAPKPKVSTCDTRIALKVLSCERVGSTVTLTYVLTNNSLGQVNEFRIIPPSSITSTPKGTKSSVSDNLGHTFNKVKFTLGNKSTSSSTILEAPLPQRTPVQGTVVVSDVPADAQSLNVILGCFAYPDSRYKLSSMEIKMKNIPIE